MDETNRICPWCSTPIPSTAAACPKCGALVEGAIAPSIPGVTVVDPTATLGPDEGIVPDIVDPKELLRSDYGTLPVNEEAFLPPSQAVRDEMRKLELEAEIENAGSEVLRPGGGETIDAGAPTIEAIEAYEAGLLDKTGPAGETDLGDLATAWEDPELEKRVADWHGQENQPK
jgi:zinc-ribbon domain